MWIGCAAVKRLDRRIGFRRLAVRASALLIVCFVAVACKLGRGAAATSAVRATETGVELRAGGDAKHPATASDVTTKSSLPVPAGSKIEVDDRGVSVVTTSAPSELRVEKRAVNLSSQVPNEPPSPQETEKAKSDFWTILGLRAGVALGGGLFIFGLIKDWNLVAAGGAAIALSCLFGLFVQQHPVLFAFVGGGVFLIGGAVFIWHTKLKNLQQHNK